MCVSVSVFMGMGRVHRCQSLHVEVRSEDDFGELVLLFDWTLGPQCHQE